MISRNSELNNQNAAKALPLIPDSLAVINYQNPLLQDLGNSGIDETLGLANCQSVTGVDAFYVIFDKTLSNRQECRTNSGAFNSKWQKKYSQWEKINNCLVFQGVNPLPKNKTDNLLGVPRFKPIGKIEYFDKEKGKIKQQKYFSPQGSKPQPFFANVPKDTCRHIWELVATRYNIPLHSIADFDDFWRWIFSRNIPITITEGEKKALALLSIGVVGVGIPGIWMGQNSKADDPSQDLREWLKFFDTADRKVYVLFDTDSGFEKRRTVGKASYRLASKFKRAECFLYQFWEGEKGIDDYLIAGNEFATIQFENLFRVRVKKQRYLSYKADLEVTQKYLDIALPESGIIGIISPTGTGKSTFMAKVCSQNQAIGKRTFIYTHRTSLGGELANRYGLPYQDEKGTKHWDELGVVRCCNSVRSDGAIRISKDMFIGADLVIDEAVSVLNSILREDTYKPYRAKVLKTLADELNTALENGGRLVLMDARLDDLTINWFRDICPGVPFHLIKNNWSDRSNIPPIKLIRTKTPSATIPLLFKWVENGEKIFVCLGAQKAASTYGTTNLASKLIKKYPHLKDEILIVDQNTIGDETHPACKGKENFDALFQQYQIVIVSPSISSGVSLDTPYFTKQLQICQGNLSINDCLQQNGRIRYPIDRYLWVATVGMDKSASRNCTPKMVLQNRKGKLGYNLSYLRLHGHDLGLEIDFGLHEKTAAELIARDNSLSINYRESLLVALQKDGYQIEDFDGAEDSKEVARAMKINSIECVREESELVANSEDLDPGAAIELEAKRGRTYQEICALEKHRIKHIYKVDSPDASFIALLKLEPQLNLKWRTHWIAINGVDYAVDRDLKNVDKFKESTGDCRPFFFDLKLGSFRHEIIKLSGITRFLEPNREWLKDSPEVLELANFYLGNFSDIRENLGLGSITRATLENKPMTAIQGMLRELFGLKLLSKKARINGKVQWIFSGIAPTSKYEEPYSLGLRERIFESWTKDWENKQLDKQESPVLTDSRVNSETGHRRDHGDGNLPVFASESQLPDESILETPSLAPSPIPEPTPEPTLSNGELIESDVTIVCSLIDDYLDAPSIGIRNGAMVNLKAYLAEVTAKGTEFKRELWAAMTPENRDLLRACLA